MRLFRPKPPAQRGVQTLSQEKETTFSLSTLIALQENIAFATNILLQPISVADHN